MVHGAKGKVELRRDAGSKGRSEGRGQVGGPVGVGRHRIERGSVCCRLSG